MNYLQSKYLSITIIMINLGSLPMIRCCIYNVIIIISVLLMMLPYISGGQQVKKKQNIQPP
jgi:hypothetical protein